MTVYQDSQQLYNSMQQLFTRIQAQGPEATQSVSSSRLIIRFHLSAPEAVVVINGRLRPVQISYGSNHLRPDLDVDMSADTFHQILLASLPLSKALASGRMKVRGPITKSFALEDILHHGQAVYPKLVQELGLTGSGL